MRNPTESMFAQLALVPAPNELLYVLLVVGAYGVLGIVLTILGFKMFDWALPHVNVEKELAQSNVAVAIVAAAALLGVAAVIVAAIVG